MGIEPGNLAFLLQIATSLTLKCFLARTLLTVAFLVASTDGCFNAC